MSRKRKTNERLSRSFKLDLKELDEDSRSIDISFSSEDPYFRFGIPEVLLHGKDNVDLSRLKDLGAALFNHNPNVIVGRTDDVRLEDDKGRAMVVFDEDEDGTKAMSKVKSGSLRGISVGYRVLSWKLLDDGDEWNGFKGPMDIATKWEPFEISFTPIPADATVGIGKQLYPDSGAKPQEETIMEKEEIKTLVGESVAKALADSMPDTINAVRAALQEDSKPKMRIDAETLMNLLGRAGAFSVDLKAEVADMAANGKTKEELIDHIFVKAAGPADAKNPGSGPGDDGVGMTHKSVVNGATVASFKQIDDDSFFAGLTNPSSFSIN